MMGAVDAINQQKCLITSTTTNQTVDTFENASTTVCVLLPYDKHVLTITEYHNRRTMTPATDLGQRSTELANHISSRTRSQD